MGKRGRSIWDILAWAMLILIALWGVLKITGVINTSLWIQYSPLFGAIYVAGWAMHKLDGATKDINTMKKRLNIVKEKIDPVENDMRIIKNNCPKYKSNN